MYTFVANILRSEDGFYVHNGIREHFEHTGPGDTTTYLPYPLYDSDDWKAKWKGTFVTCRGPTGELLNKTNGAMSKQYAYRGLPSDFPKPLVGSFEALELDNNVCFDRINQYGIYGLDQDLLDIPGSEKVLPQPIDWTRVDWGGLQEKCFEKNKERFPYHSRTKVDRNPNTELPEEVKKPGHDEIRRGYEPFVPPESTISYRSRTAILIRVWEGYSYSTNDFLNIRALITELSLRTGGEYQIFLFVNIKDHETGKRIFESREEYQKVLYKNVPRELRSIAILWSEHIFQSWYPKVGDWQVYWHQFMCVQWFSLTHPEFDYIWNWETDIRYTGNHYHLLSKITDFALKQPRKYLWERNARYYIPSVHGENYDAFVDDTNAIIKSSSAKKAIPPPIWGPRPFSPTQNPLGPRPPRPDDVDADKWGIGEEADLISLLPIWDPRHVDWVYKRKIWNYVPNEMPHFDEAHGPTDEGFDHGDFAKIDRRVVINTAMRLSKRLLRAMHEENRQGRDMQAEMFPASVALMHGFKAVYAPHPIWSLNRFPENETDALFNADGGIPGRWTQEEDSIYNQGTEKNLKSWSWYYWGELGRVLYRRWMGWKASDGMGELGGTQWEEHGGIVAGRGGGMGRLCLPGMLLHPVKNGDLWGD
ncbi:hypothetical protein NA57DRAFT_43529 [Rhizodiscina lignyota]|uniref:Uncharacterized protein n=1 Tax=Rhizodiscina lignyota TaxID=1504668 RepID=A0A9P4M3Q2_9PEZI|nr:hypothetical protein NA57DRAFT_43529 [Rhizodiscina lignyota]